MSKYQAVDPPLDPSMERNSLLFGFFVAIWASLLSATTMERCEFKLLSLIPQHDDAYAATHLGDEGGA